MKRKMTRVTVDLWIDETDHDNTADAVHAILEEAKRRDDHPQSVLVDWGYVGTMYNGVVAEVEIPDEYGRYEVEIERLQMVKVQMECIDEEMARSRARNLELQESDWIQTDRWVHSVRKVVK